MATVGQPDAMRRITVHYVNSPAHGTQEANFEGLDNDLPEFVIGDVLQDQESLYQSILDDTYNNHIRGARTTPYDNSHYYYHGESSSSAATNSRTSDIDEHIASDFEYARQLQEMEDLNIETPQDEEDDISCVASPSDTDDDNEQEAARQDDDDDDDDDDPDSMTYEQRQALVESVGSEDRGLSDQLISYLVSWKYKSGLFSRKVNHEDCPICLSTFRNRESLITLACKHNYHASCVARWLKIDKTCPVCKYEVFGPS